ncbi:cysteine dioxygenase type 1 [Hippocampus comes]|uniref:Cysteine dioxygenase n=1 Tax=Hippocampus comes TaxID=109280 RepID=A0A3Q2XGX9_HIPCM|nr:PREDICTED: cysteine dioxygenase type 1 [Hippocampus comes]XP_019743313.1 PREDICTED: cysteine dioxygenase type 1 [Hippocampus comes]
MAKTLQELIQKLHEIFKDDRVNVEEVQELMESYKSNRKDWEKYAIFDAHKYTRNLVDEGNGKFNLIILCWGEGHGSSIHDHSNSHCFMKMLQGELKETLFDWPKGEDEMTEKSHRMLENNSVAYINDSIGLHRVENVSHTEGSISLHLYSPPFQTCQVFDQRTSHKSVAKMTFWSKYGERTPCETSASKENN